MTELFQTAEMSILNCVLRDITTEIVFGVEKNSLLEETGMLIISLKDINFGYLMSTSAGRQ